MRKKHLALTVGLLLSTIGLSIPFWPFVILGILASSVMYPIVGVLIGALADVVFGVPSGMLRFAYFPFTILGLIAGLLSIFASTRLRSRNLY